tara:strand:- start:1774 stop:3603 length:1830 start_codon:yes stop_codon:yes gene_type:complete
MAEYFIPKYTGGEIISRSISSGLDRGTKAAIAHNNLEFEKDKQEYAEKIMDIKTAMAQRELALKEKVALQKMAISQSQYRADQKIRLKNEGMIEWANTMSGEIGKFDLGNGKVNNLLFSPLSETESLGRYKEIMGENFSIADFWTLHPKLQAGRDQQVGRQMMVYQNKLLSEGYSKEDINKKMKELPGFANWYMRVYNNEGGKESLGAMGYDMDPAWLAPDESFWEDPMGAIGDNPLLSTVGTATVAGGTYWGLDKMQKSNITKAEKFLKEAMDKIKPGEQMNLFDETISKAKKELDVAKNTGKWGTFKNIVNKIPALLRQHPKKALASTALLATYGLFESVGDDEPNIDAVYDGEVISPNIPTGDGPSEPTDLMTGNFAIDAAVAGWSYKEFMHPSVKEGLAHYRKTGQITDALSKALTTAKTNIRPLENMKVKAIKDAAEILDPKSNALIKDAADDVIKNKSDELSKAIKKSSTLKKKLTTQPAMTMYEIWKKKGTSWMMKEVAKKKGWSYAYRWGTKMGIGSAGAVFPEGISSVIGVGMMGWAAYDILDIADTIIDSLTEDDLNSILQEETTTTNPTFTPSTNIGPFGQKFNTPSSNQDPRPRELY